MELFRSEEMQLMQLMIPAEAAHDTVEALGRLGKLQFKDLNENESAFKKTYASQIKRCDEMGRQVRFISEQVAKAGLPVGNRLGDRHLEFDLLENRLSRLEKELMELNANSDRLQRSYNELLELQLVLETAGTFFEDSRSQADAMGSEREADYTRESAPLLETVAPLSEQPKAVQLGFVAGTIPVDKLAPFERLLYRATRGNMYLKYVPVGAVNDPVTGEKQEKAVYVVFFAGERAKAKIIKICDAFSANRYPFPEELSKQHQMSSEVTVKLRELHTTIDAGKRLLENALRTAASELDTWSDMVHRETGIYHTLNKLSVDVTRKVLMGEAWVPACERHVVQNILHEASLKANSTIGTVFQPLVTYEMPPTHYETSKFMSGFQGIVDAYGIARYREANPAVMTIVTFPFLFAVMFGDIGHGFLMLLFALWLVLSEKKLENQKLGDIVGMMFGGRYIILLMALFSIYVGMLYNEFFAMATTIFGPSKYVCAENENIWNPVEMQFNESLCPSAFEDGLAMKQRGSPYPLGFDPAWRGTRTELPYSNSLKMKMSIVMGVTQMNVGIIHSLFNQRYFGDSLSTICEFIPQMIFLNASFGYLCFLIILKWVTGSTADLYHTLIYMYLSPGDVDCSGQCPENKMFPGQGFLQVMLLLAMFVTVPWMLIPKPFILKKRHEERQQSRSVSYGILPSEDRSRVGNDEEAALFVSGASDSIEEQDSSSQEEEFNFGEVFVHQMIHTIEFVLGAVSNTASYLRLWALSLAHSQLSAVFYEKVLMGALQTGSAVGIVIGFAVFAAATLAVLMVMESLSAFLHALRLHWVEFQNKFYHGDGYPFSPFTFEKSEDEL
ncbi:hypothetical protein M9435_001618 [Picochlorum sp. BPE23]|nr:hypothetical protein M9435_001618 [Picochlorum sp. BPE23]